MTSKPFSSRCTPRPGLSRPAAPRIASRRLASRRIVIAALALLAGLLPHVPASTAEAAPDPVPVETVGPRRGLARMRAERRPVLLVVAPAASRAAVDTWWGDFGNATRKRLARGFVVIRLDLDAEGKWTPEDPPTEGETPQPWSEAAARTFITERLGEIGERSIIALFDCAGVLVAREDGDLPRESTLKKGLGETASRSARRERDLKTVEKGIEIVGLALKQKKTREACQTFTKIRAIDLPLDHPVAEARNGRYDELKEAYDTAFAVARKLEKDEKYSEALDTYERVLRDFPLAEWDDEVRARIGIVLGHIHGPVRGGGIGGSGQGGR